MEIPTAETGLSSGESPLIGREVELAQLRDALQASWTVEARLVAVLGEAGIGKSRLVAELAVEARRKGGRALIGRCHESEQVLPFAPWIDALRAGRVVDEPDLLAKLGAVWRGELARLLPEIAEAPTAPPTQDAAQLFEAIAQVFERLARVQPVLLVLEDLHWADEMSLRLLAFIVRRLGRSRMLATVTAREEGLAESALLRHTLDELDLGDHLVRVPLISLSRDESLTLARTLVPPSDTAGLGEQLWRASEGNPFMIVETLRALPAGWTPEGTPVLPLPERVRNVIANRIERLGERGRRLVAVAAVIGRPFDFPLLARAADLGEAEAAEGMEELVRHRILHGTDEAFELTHDRIREVAYSDLQAPRRALVHRRVAEALELLHAGDLDAHALALGTHYREGQVWPKAVLHLAQAGMQAWLRYAQRDAVVCYEHALSALAHLPDSRETREQETDLRFRLAHLLYGMGDFVRAMTCFRDAERLGLDLGDHRRLGEIYAGMAYLLGSEGDYAAASQSGLRALTIATSLGRQDLQIWTSIGLGRVYYAQGNYRGAIERMRWVAGAIKAAPIDEPYGRSRLRSTVACRAWLALCLAGTGDFAEALAWGDEAVQIAEAVGNAHERVWAGYCLSRVHLARGDGGRAIPLLEKAMPLCEGRIPLYWPRVVAGLGRALTMAGDLDAALPLLKQAAGEVQAIKLLFGHPLILVWTAAAHLAVGQVAEAEGYASAALQFARQNSGRADEAWALHALGEAAARREPPETERALEHSTQALALAQELGMAPLQARCHLSLGAVRHRALQALEARGELSTAIEMLTRMEMRYWLGPAQTLLADAS